MTQEDLLKKFGWEIECQSPFEIRHEDGSFATGQAAYLVYYDLKKQFESMTFTELMELQIEKEKNLKVEPSHMPLAFQILEFKREVENRMKVMEDSFIAENDDMACTQLIQTGLALGRLYDNMKKLMKSEEDCGCPDK